MRALLFLLAVVASSSAHAALPSSLLPVPPQCLSQKAILDKDNADATEACKHTNPTGGTTLTCMTPRMKSVADEKAYFACLGDTKKAKP